MKRDNLVVDKSFAFAVRVVKLYAFLTGEKKEYVLAKQILRSGTSVGANIEEAVGAQSDKDFLAKMTIAYKEARETLYWLRLLHATDFLTEAMFQSLANDVDEICKIIGRIQITLKKRLQNE